jgi:uncharacterized protein (DUF58 family)
VHIRRRSESEQQTEQLFVTRGRFIIKDFELSTKFPFGFWQRRRRLRVQETEIFIFPELSDVRDVLSALSKQAGRFASPRRGAGHDLLGLREYQPSDDLRYVDWKATARTGNLVTREYSNEDEQRLTIVFDPNLHPEKPGEETTLRFEHGVSIAAALVTRFINEKTDVRLVTDNENNNFGQDKAHLYKSLRRLAIIEPQFEETSLECFDVLSGYLRTEDLTVLLTARPEKFLSSSANDKLHIITF